MGSHLIAKCELFKDSKMSLTLKILANQRPGLGRHRRAGGVYRNQYLLHNIYTGWWLWSDPRTYMYSQSYKIFNKKNKESCNRRWCPNRASISTSLSHSGITWRDRRHRDNLRPQMNRGMISKKLETAYLPSIFGGKKSEVVLGRINALILIWIRPLLFTALCMKWNH